MSFRRRLRDTPPGDFLFCAKHKIILRSLLVLRSFSEEGGEGGLLIGAVLFVVTLKKPHSRTLRL